MTVGKNAYFLMYDRRTFDAFIEQKLYGNNFIKIFRNTCVRFRQKHYEFQKRDLRNFARFLSSIDLEIHLYWIYIDSF